MSPSRAVATPARRPVGKLRRFGIGLAGWGASLLITLVLLEIALRVLGIKPGTLPYHNNLGDAVLGMAPEKNMVWKANFPEYGGKLVMRTNNLGFYEEEDTTPLPAPGVTRIVALGDSFTVGVCTPPENFPNQIEQHLNAAAGSRKFEVIDAGVGRYSPYQYYLKARVDAVPLHAQRLLVAFYAGNDYLDIIREDDRPYLSREPDGTVKAHPPHFVVYKDPSEKPSSLEASRTYSIAHAALGPTLLYQISRAKLLYLNLSDAHRGIFEIGKYLKQVRELDRISHGLMVQSLHQYVWFQRFPDTLPTSTAFTKYTLEKLRELAQQNAIALTVTVIPSKPAVEPETLQPLFAKITRHSRELTVDRVAAFENARINETLAICQSLAIDAYDLRPGFAQRRSGRVLYYPEDMHLNVAGNALVADLISEYWKSQGVIR
jgi:SGNH hydrolase-like domain, acetyltransferase AlgX